jgi:signal transduction histidine kinase
LTVSISVERLETELRCVIADDGVGFDVDAVLVDGAKRGLGLLGMRERASAVAGTCAIRSAPGEGTAIEIVVPLGGVASLKG